MTSQIDPRNYRPLSCSPDEKGQGGKTAFFKSSISSLASSQNVREQKPQPGGKSLPIGERWKALLAKMSRHNQIII